MAAKTKLELTWIGKDKRHRLEPRILIEDSRHSHHASVRKDGDLFDNVLIRGDNLLALKALQATHFEQVKCIYIDPPFNTGAAMPDYPDGLEHSIWLGLMRDRLTLLSDLLSPEGSIFIHLDDNEIDYMKVIADETFGRSNFINRITVSSRSPSAFSTVNPGVFKASEYILWYAKDRSAFPERSGRIKRTPNYAYSKWLANPNDHHSEWRFSTVSESYASQKTGEREISPPRALERFNDFIIKNASHIWRPTEISDTAAGKNVVDAKKRSLSTPGKVVEVTRPGLETIYVLDGKQISFYSKNVRELDGETVATELLTNIWTDIAWEGIAGEGGVTFKKGKKPERLIRRCIQLASDPGDIVLDSFGGSGTTGAVAHKMKRRWIMVEMGDHAETHIVPRLQRVIDGSDQTGVSKVEGWKGGGGYRYFKLAPSLLEKDQFDNWVISKAYNAEMLAEAMCKHFGFTYAPSDEHYWMHGHSSETDFFYVTTNSLTHEQLAAISDEVGSERTLLICCKAFQGGNADAFGNLTIRKIPGAILDRCEWGKDDYSLKIEALPLIEDEPEEAADDSPRRKSAGDPNQPGLFSGHEEVEA